MPEFMKKCFDLAVIEESRFLLGGLGKVGQHRAQGRLQKVNKVKPGLASIGIKGINLS